MDTSISYRASVFICLMNGTIYILWVWWVFSIYSQIYDNFIHSQITILCNICAFVSFFIDVDPTDFTIDGRTMLVGGEVCLWLEYADDAIVMPRLW